jgi:choline dehydrogenase-like flavoprotein
MQELGKPVAPIPQNCLRPGECSVNCGVGCVAGGKQDAARTWLADAAASGRLTLLTRCHALRVVVEAQKCSTGRKQVARGVLADLVRP